LATSAKCVEIDCGGTKANPSKLRPQMRHFEQLLALSRVAPEGADLSEFVIFYIRSRLRSSLLAYASRRRFPDGKRMLCRTLRSYAAAVSAFVQKMRLAFLGRIWETHDEAPFSVQQ